jgi:hypothetical protein
LVRLVVRHGVDVAAVVTNTHDACTAIKAAALARERGRCAVPGCGRTRNLQLHHTASDTGYRDTGETRLEQLAWVDQDHHDDITHRGAELGGRHPKWTWKPPDPDKARARDQAKAKKRHTRKPRDQRARE